MIHNRCPQKTNCYPPSPKTVANLTQHCLGVTHRSPPTRKSAVRAEEFLAGEQRDQAPSHVRSYRLNSAVPGDILASSGFVPWHWRSHRSRPKEKIRDQLKLFNSFGLDSKKFQMDT